MIQHTDSVWECWTEAGMLQCQNGPTLWSDGCVCVGHNYVTSSLKPFPSSLPLTFPRGNYIYTSRWIINKMNHKEFQITSQRTLINTTINSVNVRPHTEPHVQPKPRQSEHGDAWTNIDVFFIYFQNHYPAIHFMLLKNTCSGRWTFSCNSLWMQDVRTVFNFIYFYFLQWFLLCSLLRPATCSKMVAVDLFPTENLCLFSGVHEAWLI